jgi:hypothetical protein
MDRPKELNRRSTELCTHLKMVDRQATNWITGSILYAHLLTFVCNKGYVY